jgi:carboxyl-terminal processing protease
MESQGMEKLIVDLRDDPGGLYDVAVDMVDIFLDRDLEVAYVEDNTGKKQWSYTNDLDTFDKPVVILINGNSASASELFTQTLREYNKATVIGTKSYGKGVYQNLYPLSVDGAVIKITGGRYFSPKGFCVDGVGIEPDITVEYVKIDPTITDPELTDDNQIKAAVDFLNEIK